MRVSFGWGISLGIFCATLTSFAAPVSDGGGRDVSVALFSTRSLHSVTMTPVGANAWIARCVRCTHMPLTAALHIDSAKEIFAGGVLRLIDDATGDTRTAAGLWHLRTSNLRSSMAGGQTEIDVVLTLPSERYVAAVLNAEAAAGEPTQSLRALAIVARTYALNGNHFTAQAGHLAAELCDSTECQAMLLAPVSAAIEDAVRATAGETLWFGGKRAQVYFSQSCGGVTEDAGAVWPTLQGVPFLRSHADPYCVRRDPAQWHSEVPLAKFAEIARAERWRVPANSVAAHVVERSVSHRALRVAFTGADGVTAIISASALRFGVGRALGWNQIRSDAYELGIRNGMLVFDGRGHGHGVGLCQQGATQMASEGKSTREILAFYFPETVLRILPDDHGWQKAQAGALTLQSTREVLQERKAALEQLWSEAQRRFPPRHAITPEIIFTPTTEVFRQMTTQPGWALASTRGTAIVLQPDSVLRAHGRNGSATVLHEMLHVLVEDEACDRAPVWLREGIVGSLAGEPEGKIAANAMSAMAIDNALLHADSLRQSELAHVAAETRVRILIAHYGLPTVRGWLSSGLPLGVE